MILIRSSTDAGCPITEEEHDAYADLALAAVQKAYPEEEVGFSWVMGTGHVIRDGFHDSDLQQVVQQVWEDGGFWMDNP